MNINNEIQLVYSISPYLIVSALKIADCALQAVFSQTFLRKSFLSFASQFPVILPRPKQNKCQLQQGQ